MESEAEPLGGLCSHLAAPLEPLRILLSSGTAVL